LRDFQLSGRSAVFADHAMCATSHPLAVSEAVNVMRGGGNAVDAALTGALMLGLLEPAMTGIGGDMFAMIWKAGEARPIGLNGSGRAPAALDAAKLRADGLSAIDDRSVHAVTVPGAIDGFDVLLRDHGTYGWDKILAPSIKLARDGAIIAERTAFDYGVHHARLSGDAQRHFLSEDGGVPVQGTRIRYAAQAEALEAIAERGRAGFYEGPVAEDMVTSLRALGGVHTLEDFAATKADYVAPLSGDYRGTTLWELPPNGQGAVALLMLKILEGFNIGELDPFGAERAHIEAEAARLAYHARDCLIGDGDTPGAEDRLEHLLSEETVTAMRARIDASRRSEALLDGLDAYHSGGAPHRDTIYLTTVDASGMMVSLIYSVFHAFGSGLASSRYGIGFQCRGAGFTLEDGHPNELKGSKRPLHTIIPAMLSRDGAPLASFGVMGGAYQPNGHARVTSNLVDFGMNPQAALDGPRSFASAEGLQIERGYPADVSAALQKMGHQPIVPETAVGGAQIIMRDPESGALIGGSDPRKDGCALGY